MSYLIDTNIISELRKRDRADPAVLRWANLAPVTTHHTSVLVIGEIRRGIERKRRHDPVQAARLEFWLHGIARYYQDRILPVDRQIAEAWGHLGVPKSVPDIDGLLVATAMVHRLTFVTRDRGASLKGVVPVVNPFMFQ